MPFNYFQIAVVFGLFVLLALGFYAVRLVTSFRTGMLAKSWKEVTIGALILIIAQFPFFVAGFGIYETVFVSLGMGMRFLGVIFLIIGLRAQSRVWGSENKKIEAEVQGKWG